LNRIEWSFDNHIKNIYQYFNQDNENIDTYPLKINKNSFSFVKVNNENKIYKNEKIRSYISLTDLTVKSYKHNNFLNHTGVGYQISLYERKNEKQEFECKRKQSNYDDFLFTFPFNLEGQNIYGNQSNNKVRSLYKVDQKNKNFEISINEKDEIKKKFISLSDNSKNGDSQNNYKCIKKLGNSYNSNSSKGIHKKKSFKSLNLINNNNTKNEIIKDSIMLENSDFDSFLSANYSSSNNSNKICKAPIKKSNFYPNNLSDNFQESLKRNHNEDEYFIFSENKNELNNSKLINYDSDYIFKIDVTNNFYNNTCIFPFSNNHDYSKLCNASSENKSNYKIENKKGKKLPLNRKKRKNRQKSNLFQNQISFKSFMKEKINFPRKLKNENENQKRSLKTKKHLERQVYKSKFNKLDKHSELYFYDICSNDEKETGNNIIMMDFEKEDDIDNYLDFNIDNIVIDYGCLNEISGGNYLIERELIMIFLNEFPDKIKQLKSNFENTDLFEIQILANSLKSTFAIFGVENLRKKFSEIENSVKNNSWDYKKKEKFKNFVLILERNIDIIKRNFAEKYKELLT